MALAYIALGSNLRDPMHEVGQAMTELDTLPETRLVKASSLYCTAPVGYDNQPDFINAVAAIDTGLEPMALLQAILDLENRHGRERPFPNAPRVLDLDLLLYEQVVMNTPALTLPHPRMHQRGFVLLPLAEIAPELHIAGYGSVADLAKQCADQGVVLLQEQST
ncbi:2-amino-4-hydroxy-6-hydroxymethyldihydropteridine diphosphokinase [Methylobacillus flagellatus]|uniref:2-amino-4-hydroxy-6-hydroxymethyldihydropteridine pyrophosphokinase n=1 Tax=Methylobacillus flagellatus (strain ATCC 51484 / DSM 6875 / VKM B-1610 / KT) TaxID=265072 RepID=Q1H3R8_METFK|nr:2-amino-4-hydroxy-6-hydroxymethyldihydropteridine diphosphokinase [Methylobacillus flagellatus]ABE48869.1 2-amino-4-hydroxy-6-hydroxymethyldihydropteridine pyrophosphokinase [Methylobacillus flagellatus KT]